MIIRAETAQHIDAIRALNLSAFPTEAEANLVDALRKNGDAEICLIAMENDEVLGFVMLSKMIAPFHALALAPVTVREDQRECGLAAALISEALNRAGRGDWDGVFVLGSPDYFQRYGFSPSMALGFECSYAGPYFMALALREEGLPVKTGKVDYAPAFAYLETPEISEMQLAGI